VDLRWRARAFVRGLLADLPRKNLRNADASLVNVDEHGKLRCDLPAEEPLAMVEVVNATP
jgi:hypothetical protein